MSELVIEKIHSFKPRRILVIGDLILDQYTICNCNRISPEAPVLVLKVKETKYNVGGAANTAVNIKTLGSIPVLTGIIGLDQHGEAFLKELLSAEIKSDNVLKLPSCGTIIKQRIVANNQQVVRVDYNDSINLDKSSFDLIKQIFLANIGLSDIVVISDYGKGTLSSELVAEIIRYCKQINKIIIIDPKPEHTSAYHDASFITPNFKEACEMVGKKLPFDIDSAKVLSMELSVKLDVGVILTMSEFGIFLYYNGFSHHFPTFQRQVRDVSGAGDTVVGALAVALANGLSIQEAVYFANHAAGVKVEKLGVQPVYLDEVISDIKLHNNL